MSELTDFVLNALRQAGGLVDPPAFDRYDVLLPDEVARRWQVPVYQRLAFAEAPQADNDREPVTAIGYGHPLLETLVEEIRAEPACMQVFINSLRTDKRGLFSLACQALAFPNARLSEAPRQGEVVAVCHYARFNFKAALITDEKWEQLVSVVMDVQAGFAVPELARLEQLVQLEDEPAPGRHLPAPVRWLPGQAPLSRLVLDTLLERAIDAALRELAAPLGALRRRAVRYLELDRSVPPVLGNLQGHDRLQCRRCSLRPGTYRASGYRGQSSPLARWPRGVLRWRRWTGRARPRRRC